MPLLWTSKYHKQNKKIIIYGSFGGPLLLKIWNYQFHSFTYWLSLLDIWYCWYIVLQNWRWQWLHEWLLRPSATEVVHHVYKSLSGQWQSQVQCCPSSGQHPQIPANQESGSVVSPDVQYVPVYIESIFLKSILWLDLPYKC